MRLEIFLFLMWLCLIYAYNAKNVDSKDVIFVKNPSQGNNRFGHSVALARNYVYVGAPLDDTHGNVLKCRFTANNLYQQNPKCSKVDGKSLSDKFKNCKFPIIFPILVGVMTKKTNKNLFGMTVTALNDRVVSCAHMEPINGTQTFQETIRRKFGYPQLGKLFKLYK